MRGKILAVWGLTSLVLFFALFFGLNYPEIVRRGWPLTRCLIESSRADQRYCCELDCSASCASTRSNTPSCNSIISQIDNQYSPSVCANNSTACPSTSGSCDNGYKCCGQCCQTCKSCSTTCQTSSDGHQTCSQTCSSYQCNCTCCVSTFHQGCSYFCPTCYNDVLDISYTTYGGQNVNTTFQHDFGKDSGSAQQFLNAHQQGSSSACYYNPKSLSEVAFDVNFTAWKWAVTAIFGMVPFLAFLLCIIAVYAIFPLFGVVKRHLQRRTIESSNDLQEPEQKQDDAPPPPYQPAS